MFTEKPFTITHKQKDRKNVCNWHINNNVNNNNNSNEKGKINSRETKHLTKLDRKYVNNNDSKKIKIVVKDEIIMVSKLVLLKFQFDDIYIYIYIYPLPDNLQSSICKTSFISSLVND